MSSLQAMRMADCSRFLAREYMREYAPTMPPKSSDQRPAQAATFQPTLTAVSMSSSLKGPAARTRVLARRTRGGRPPARNGPGRGPGESVTRCMLAVMVLVKQSGPHGN